MDVQMVAEDHRNLSIVCFGDSDWWYHNRGHMDIQLMKQYAKVGKVLYVNSIVVRKFNVGEGAMFFCRLRRKLGSILKGVRPSGIENLTVYSPFTMPVHHIPVARQINEIALRLQIRRCIERLNIEQDILWVACPGAAEVASRLPHKKLVYQRSDRYEEFPGVDSEQIRRYDKLLKEHADLVIYVNQELMAQEEPECKKAVFLDHGVDYEAFAGAHTDPYVPEEMRRIPRPILGFYGGIDEHTTDISLVEDIADLLSDISIVMIGDSNIELPTLGSHKNIFLLSQKPYEQIPHYAKCFDVCFMPWKQNEWIRACNPIKLKEYMAMGKPIVSTPFSELDRYRDHVYVASDARSFANAVRTACGEDNQERTSARRKQVRDSTWTAKAKDVLQALYETN